jgi:hypothetical protein
MRFMPESVQFVCSGPITTGMTNAQKTFQQSFDTEELQAIILGHPPADKKGQR